MFFLHGVLTIAQFLQMARKWEMLAKQMFKVDAEMRDYHGSGNLEKNMKALTFIIMTAAAGK